MLTPEKAMQLTTQAIVKLISEMIVYAAIVFTLATFTHPAVVILFVINSIAGSIIVELVRKAPEQLTAQIQKNRISILYGVNQVWRNNTWWRR